MHAATVVWSMALALSPVPPSDGPLAGAWEHEGDWGLAPTFDDGGTPLRPGDDEVGLAQTVYAMRLQADLRGLPAGAVLAPAEVEVDLRGAKVPHPVYRLLRAADRALGDDQAVDLYADEEGVDVGSPLLGRAAGEEKLPWNNLLLQEDLGHPVRIDASDAGPEPRLLDTSDGAVRRADAMMAEVCELYTEHTLGASEHPELAPPCASALAPVLAPATPNVRLHSELQSVRVSMAGIFEGLVPPPRAGPGGAAAPPPAGEGSPGAGGHEALPRTFEVPDPGLAQGQLAGMGAPAVPAPARDAPLRAFAAPRAPGDLAASVLLGLAVAAFLVPLYRRLLSDGVLKHEARERILAIVQARPGIHESALARELGVGANLAQYHVRMLAEFGLLEVRRFGGRKCLFAPGHLGRAEKALAMAGRGSGARVLELVASQPGIGQRELARALGVRESTAKWHLDRLEAAELLDVERSALGKRVRLRADLAQARAAAAASLPPAQAEPPAPVAPPGPVAVSA